MNEMRSCAQCRYGPSIIDCMSTRTAKNRIGEASTFESNYLSPSIMYYLDMRYHNNMPCCESSNEFKQARIAKNPPAVREIVRGNVCLFCAYGPSVWECRREQDTVEDRYEAYANSMFDMPCFIKEGAKQIEKPEREHSKAPERPSRRDEGSNSLQKALVDIVIFFVVLAIIALILVLIMPNVL